MGGGTINGVVPHLDLWFLGGNTANAAVVSALCLGVRNPALSGWLGSCTCPLGPEDVKGEGGGQSQGGGGGTRKQQGGVGMHPTNGARNGKRGDIYAVQA
jgi:hypothetical protein